MSQSVRRFLVALGLLGVCSLFAIPTVAQKSPSVPQALPVNVENTPNVNVANTPSVSVTNTPSVNVANSPTVTLEPGASVAVTSPLDGSGNPAPIATLEAVQLYGSSCSISFNGSGGALCFFTTVPEGKELVIQEFDAQGGVEAGNRPLSLALLYTISSGNYFTYTFEVNSYSFDYLSTHQETRVYVIGGTTPACSVTLPQNSQGQYSCNISGFLVDTPLGGSSIVAPQKPLPLPSGRNLGQGRQANNSGR